MAIKRLGRRSVLIVFTVISGVFFLCALLAGIDERVSGDGMVTLFGSRFAAVEITADEEYPRGSLIRLQQGSIPENTPVAVRTQGVLVLSDSRLSESALDGKNISREQILGSVDLRIPYAGWLFILTGSDTGFVLSLLLSLLICGVCGGLMIRMHLAAAEQERQEALDAMNTDTIEDLFPELDYKLKSRPSPTVENGVKTLVITQTRAASSAIRSQKGEVRIYASGQEKVLPLNIGRRVVHIGGYNITVDISKAPERTTEDITKELPVIHSGTPKNFMDPETSET